MTGGGGGQARTGPYVALGDSISIDDYAGGPGRGGASLLARNRDQDFPAWQHHDLHDRSLLMLATDGATTKSVLEHQLPRLQRSGSVPSVVTLTAGGNDVLGSYGDTAGATAAADDALSQVDETLALLRPMVAADAQLVLGTVYDPSDGTGDATRVGLPAWTDVVDVIAHLNRGLREVAARHGAAVAEIHDRFRGHGLSRGNPAQRDSHPSDRGLWFCNVIEPNAWGASGVRAAFWTALGHRPPDRADE